MRDNLVFRVTFSPRYLVLGGYKDRHLPLVRLYPLPFTRVTVGRINRRLLRTPGSEGM